MKIIIFFLLITGTASAQTVTVSAMNTAISKAIAAQAKIQANTDGVQNTRLASVEKQDTVYFDKRYFNVVGRNVNFNIDSVQKYIKFPSTSVDLTAINNSIATLNNSVTSLGIRVTSLEQWRTVAQGSLDKINTTISLLPPIPTKAVSVSTSTTTTTTTTTLQ